MDPHRDLRGAVVGGMSTGIVLGYLRMDLGVVVRGHSGPERVIVPMRFFTKRPAVGSELGYYFKICKTRRVALATRLISRQGEQS